MVGSVNGIFLGVGVYLGCFYVLVSHNLLQYGCRHTGLSRIASKGVRIEFFIL